MAKRPKPLTQKEIDAALQGLRWDNDRGFEITVTSAPTERYPDRRWSIGVHLGAMHVRLRQLRNGFFQLDLGSRDRQGRFSTEERDIDKAIFFAQKYIDAQREQRGKDAIAADLKRLALDEGISVGQVREILPYTKLAHKKSFPTYMRKCATVEYVLGSGLKLALISQREVDSAVARIAAGLRELGRRPVSINTAIEYLQDFATAITYVKALDPRELGLPGDYVMVPKHPLVDGNIIWPDKEQDNRREAATMELYALLMTEFVYVDENGTTITLPAPVDAVDPSGQLRLILATMFWTGRRIEAVLQLRFEDDVKDRSRMREILRKSDYGERKWADYFPRMLNFIREHDKEGHHWPIPMADGLAVEWDLFYSRVERRKGRVFSLSYGQVVREPCFKSDQKTDKRRFSGVGLIEKAYYLAASYLERAGRSEDVSKYLPVRPRDTEEYPGDAEFISRKPDDPIGRWAFIAGHKLHIWRHCHVTIMDELGWGGERDDKDITLDVYASYLASWATGSKSTRDDRYRHQNPELMVACANFVESHVARASVTNIRSKTLTMITAAVRHHAAAQRGCSADSSGGIVA